MSDPQRLRILHLISSAGFFGAENVVMRLCRELSVLGHEVFVGVIERSRDTGWPRPGEGFKMVRFESRGKFDLRAVFGIRRFMLDRKIDVVNSHNYKADFLGYFAAWGLPAVKVATCHNWLARTPALRSYARLDKFLLGAFDAVVPVSPTLRETLLKAGVRDKRVCVIPNGISAPSLRGTERVDVRREMRIGRKEVLVISVGRFSEEKGHNVLLQAFSSMVRTRPHARLLLAGDGPRCRWLKEEARQLDIAHKVIFAGFRSDVDRLLAASDVFVLPSLTEAMPLALLEALAAGIPCVATRVGSVPRLLGQDEYGLLVEPGDPRPLSVALLKLLGDPASAAAMAARGREMVLRDYSSRTMAERYCQVYARAKGLR